MKEPRTFLITIQDYPKDFSLQKFKKDIYRLCPIGSAVNVVELDQHQKTHYLKVIKEKKP